MTNDDKPETRITRSASLAQPSDESLQEMPVKRMDWRRLRRDVEEIGEVREATLAWDLFLWFLGTSAAALIGVLVLPEQFDHPLIRPALWFAVAGTAACAVLCLVFHFQTRTKRPGRVKRICGDMDSVERDFYGSVESEPAPTGFGARLKRRNSKDQSPAGE